MSKKILIIDDEGSDRKGISIALGKEGYSEIIVADTGDAGVQMAKSFSPDIILIDVVLQGMDGFDVCRQIKEDGECQAKIIMITGHLDAVDAEKARKSSANEIIEKTVSFENISQVIAKLT